MTTKDTKSGLELPGWFCREYVFEGEERHTVTYCEITGKWLVDDSRSLAFDTFAAAMHHVERDWKNLNEPRFSVPEPIVMLPNGQRF